MHALAVSTFPAQPPALRMCGGPDVKGHAIASAEACCLIRFDGGTAQVRSFQTRTMQPVTMATDRIELLVPIAGAAMELTGDGRRAIDPGAAAVLARAGIARFEWSAGSVGLFVSLARTPLQARLTERRGVATRFTGINHVATQSADLAAAIRSALPLLMEDSGGRSHEAAGERIEAALIETLAGDARWARLLATNRAVQLAAEAVRTLSGAAPTPDGLASAAGVTTRTLREGFAACYGLSLSQFILREHLHRARAQLAGGRDSRPIAEVARAAGFANASSFTRAYLRLFAETPTTTRAVAVRSTSTRWLSR